MSAAAALRWGERRPRGAGRVAAAVLGLLAALATPAAATIPVELPRDLVPSPLVDVLALTPEMRSWVHREIPSSLSPVERLNLLVRRLQSKDGAGMRYDAWYTASAADAFNNRRFNCLSFSHLVVAMARELGLEAYYLEARYRERYNREGDLVLLAGHVTVGWGEGLRGWAVEFGPQRRLDTSSVVRIDDRRALALHYANLGASALRNGDPTAALGDLATAVAVDPRAGAAWVNLGVALRRSGDTGAAEASYRRAIHEDGGLMPGYANLYALLRSTGRTEETARLVAEIIRMPNRDPWLLLAMGDECMSAHDLSAAERLFKKAHARAREEAAPAAAIASLALARGNQPMARKWLRRAEERDPREPRLVTLRAALGLPPLAPLADDTTAAGRPAAAPSPIPSPQPD
jgi:tetratricopeptide (TPR) repeat protein